MRMLFSESVGKKGR